MKIRKYEGGNEKEAMLKVKEELGKDALIVSVKNIRPKGFFKLFRKPYVEVTAALDDHSVLDDGDREPNIPRKPAVGGGAITMTTDDVERQNDRVYFERFKAIMENLPTGAVQAKPVVEAKPVVKPVAEPKGPEEVIDGEEDVEVANATLIKAVYDQLVDNEVREEVVNTLISGVAQISSSDSNELTDVISVVYKRIIHELSDFETITEDGPKAVFFIGPTGVGKTTTIAKVASYFTLNLGKKVGLITSDTYRIAAVEQLRTYANILNVPIKVVYSKDELEEAVDAFDDMDLILIDTAGRSHRNAEHQDDLKSLLGAVDRKEIYLVLSAATKYKDLISITDKYNEVGPYKIIFTKLDETSCYGNILNVKSATGAKLSYVTFGQNVPDDISDINPHDVARQVLGGAR